jgi:hypothetical protein
MQRVGEGWQPVAKASASPFGRVLARLLDVELWEGSTPPAHGTVEQSSPAPPRRRCRLLTYL